MYKLVVPFFVFALFFGFTASAQEVMPQQMEVQEDFPEEDIKKFVDVNLQVMPIQEKYQSKMMESIEESGMTVERFEALSMAQQNGDIREASEDPEELAAYNKAGQEIMQIQSEMQNEVVGHISESDLGPEKFQQIYMAYTQSEKVRAKIDKMMADAIED
ncbi:hypothetical protein A33Q_0254 [Indibacter alkaliphilus LW1]|uniref:DUF4168 domain-containing protein n=1 Tax=Indibacter alkaliphilus (strain CCUG 57479 / KCTC 22604 / LW1) TaxID=1189612 RepID=S2DS41_INDAL|nr:DUF4168 domain-containing protein [Indibacter alkaliphilus]EPA00086.1 hypothetical protein A33Q_0254 [Indibacter alkaliphilus LW1]